MNLTLNCRSCGQIFCADCSEYWAALPDERLFTPVRLCAPCYHSITNKTQVCSFYEQKKNTFPIAINDLIEFFFSSYRITNKLNIFQRMRNVFSNRQSIVVWINIGTTQMALHQASSHRPVHWNRANIRWAAARKTIKAPQRPPQSRIDQHSTWCS